MTDSSTPKTAEQLQALALLQAQAITDLPAVHPEVEAAAAATQAIRAASTPTLSPAEEATLTDMIEKQVALCDPGVNPFTSAADSARRQSELVGYSLAVFAGQPCLTFYTQETDVAVSISPNGLLAIDPEMPMGIHYPVTIVGPIEHITDKEIVEYVSSALGAFNMAELVSCLDRDSLVNAGEVPVKVSKSEIERLHGDTFIMKSFISFLLNPETHNQCVELLEAQLGAVSVLGVYNKPADGEATH